MLKYCKGEKVKVVYAQKNIPAMRMLVGKTVTIRDGGPASYSIEEDGGRYIWSANWLEPIINNIEFTDSDWDKVMGD